MGPVPTGTVTGCAGQKLTLSDRTQSKPDAADESRIKQLNKEISSLEREVAKLREKSSGISDQIKELQNKIMEVGGVKLRAIQSKVTVTKGLLDMANESITKAEVGQAKAQRDIEKLNKALESNKVKIEEAEAEAEVVDGDLAACTADLNVLREKVQEAMDASTDVQEALAEAKAELDEKSGHINAFRALEVGSTTGSLAAKTELTILLDGYQAEDRGQRSDPERQQEQVRTLEKETR